MANLDVFKSVMLMSFIFAYLRNCLKQYQNLNYYRGRLKRERWGKRNHIFKEEEKILLYIPAHKPSSHRKILNLSIKATRHGRHEQ